MNKNVPKLRFKGFEDESKSFKFKQLVKLQRGSSPRPIVKYITNSDDGVNWIKIGDVSKGESIITSTKEKITKEGALKSRFVKVGDLILSNSMSYGRPYIMGIDGYIHDGWFVLKDYENNFKRDYLCQLLTSPVIQKQYKKLAAGGVVDNISSELVNSVIIKLPSLQEQEKIANFLSKVDSIIEKQEKKVEYWNSYKKGMMQKIFLEKIRFKDENGRDYPEWEEKRLEEICIIVMGQSPSSASYNDDNIGVPLVQGNADIYNKRTKPRLYTSEITKMCNENDIIMSVRAPVGSIAIADRKCCIGRGVCAIKSKENQSFLYQFLLDKEDKWGKISQGSTFESINSNDIKRLKIMIPNIKEQEKIAEFLLNIDSLVEKETKKLEELKQWKKGLLQQMFV